MRTILVLVMFVAVVAQVVAENEKSAPDSPPPIRTIVKTLSSAVPLCPTCAAEDAAGAAFELSGSESAFPSNLRQVGNVAGGLAGLAGNVAGAPGTPFGMTLGAAGRIGSMPSNPIPGQSIPSGIYGVNAVSNIPQPQLATKLMPPPPPTRGSIRSLIPR